MIRELALFGGGGGGLLASNHLLGWTTRCAVEIDPYARKILLARQRDGMLPVFPSWDDVKTFDGRAWRNSIDVISGGFPCQDISSSGKKGGITGPRSSLFFQLLRISAEAKPRFIFTENSPDLRVRGLATILQEFKSLGYDVRHIVLGAWHVGALHKRNRMWILAHRPPAQKPLANPSSLRHPGPGQPVHAGDYSEKTERKTDRPINVGFNSVWKIEPSLGRVAYGVADRVDRLKALGNGQVPAVAFTAWQILSSGLLDGP